MHSSSKETQRHAKISKAHARANPFLSLTPFEQWTVLRNTGGITEYVPENT